MGARHSKSLRSLLLAAGASAIALTAAAQAQDVYSFGDSLSDTGNVTALTFGLEGGAEYFNGRFSNGFVWNDYLSVYLSGDFQRTNPGLIGPVAIGRTAPYNFAHGGAVSGSNGLNFEVILDGRVQGALLEAIPAFRATDQAEHFRRANLFGFRTFRPGPNDVATISAGGNDYFNFETDVDFVVGNIIQSLNSIRRGGVRTFGILNLPNIGDIPARIDTPERGLLNALSAQHNATLNARVSGFINANPGTRAFIVDLGTLFDLIVADAQTTGGAQFGFSVVAPGPGTTGNCLGDGLVLSACPGNYLFYDGIHPTARAHAIIGNLSFSALLSVLATEANAAARLSSVSAQFASENRLIATRFDAARTGLRANAFITESAGGLTLTPAGDAPRASANGFSFFRFVDGVAPEYSEFTPGDAFDPASLAFSLDLQDAEYTTAYGADYLLNGRWLFGAVATRASRGSDALNIDSQNESRSFAVFAGYADGPLSLSVTARAASVDARFTRETAFAFAPVVNGAAESLVSSTRFDAAYAIPAGPATAAALLRVSHTAARHRGFEETGGLGLVDRIVPNQNVSGETMFLGAAISSPLPAPDGVAAALRLEAGGLYASAREIGFGPVIDDVGLIADAPLSDDVFDPLAAEARAGAFVSLGLDAAISGRFSMAAKAARIETARRDAQVARLSARFAF